MLRSAHAPLDPFAHFFVPLRSAHAPLVRRATPTSLASLLPGDTRLADFTGEPVIMREEAPGGGGGEVIKSSTIPGGLLTSEICVLDDISRAPGEALNVLLRILNERRFGTPSEDIPLMTAIATSNPAGEDQYYAEPLDPANLDRFTIQLQASGLVQQGDWAAASAVIDLYASRDGREEVETVGRDAIEQAQVGSGAASSCCSVCVQV